MTSHTNQNESTKYGQGALESINIGRKNSAFGIDALRGSTKGYNTAFGAYAGANIGPNFGDSAFGSNALRFNNGRQNTAVGNRSMVGDKKEDSHNASHNVPDSTSYARGDNNTACGSETMSYNPQGDNNTAIGYAVMKSLADHAENNIGAGANTFCALTKGHDNTGVGYKAGSEIKNGSYNTLLGSETTVSESSSKCRIAIGSGVVATHDNTIIIGRYAEDEHDNVGIGTSQPEATLHIRSNDSCFAKAALSVDGGQRRKVVAFTGNVYNLTVNDHVIICENI